ncbi:MAG: hypothetical protein ABS81_07445 [Pseudonocardia sp. SCN 72-86]|nr:MAG: hypothetical protein ABS81_07445 [Pseudonocardia sp. SCN 72-86]
MLFDTWDAWHRFITGPAADEFSVTYDDPGFELIPMAYVQAPTAEACGTCRSRGECFARCPEQQTGETA